MDTEQLQRLDRSRYQAKEALTALRLADYPNPNLERAKLHLIKTITKYDKQRIRILREAKVKPATATATWIVCNHCGRDFMEYPHTRGKQGKLICPKK